MSELLESIMPEEEREEFKELISSAMMLTREDRAVLQLNVNAFKVLRDVEKAKKENK